MRSLTLRLTLLTGLWVATGLGGAGWFVADIATRQIEAAFDARIGTVLDTVIAAATQGADGRIRVAPLPAGTDFERPFSGAYWQVTRADGSVTTSRSLWDQTLPAGRTGHVGVLLRDIPGPRGSQLRVAERDVVLLDASEPAHFSVALSTDAQRAEVDRLRRILIGVFALLGLGLVAGVAIQVVVGLAPLRLARRTLAEVRAGTRDRLGLAAPAEIAPLVAEVDALIEQNRATVERARAHVGNLAHALKTPIAVLRNALGVTPPDIGSARAEAASLERLVQHHLARARVTALTTATGMPEVSPLAVTEEVAAALRRLFTARDLTISVTGDARVRLRTDAQDLTEMLGNLMENACQWATAQVSVTVTGTADSVVISVEDDGPGLPAGAEGSALARGGRLDEAAPGSGLGLAIVADLVALQGGDLALSRAAAGGLRADLRLPRRGAG
jgi:signal transduction histidine kinase